MQKYLDYLYFPGIILVIAGLVAGQVGGQWTPVTIGLLIVGGVLLLAWILLWLNTNRDFWGRRSTQVGTNAFISTLAVIAILVVINFLVVRYPVRADFTENQRFTLSPQTQQTIENLSQPVKVWLFTTDQSPAELDLLENYRRQGDQFSFEYVDPQIEVGKARQFQVQTLGEVHLEYGDKKQLVQSVSLGGGLSEEKLTNAIEKIQRDETASIYLLQGHGEPELQPSEGGLSEASTALENKGFLVQTLNLAETPQIPADAAAIALIGPKQPLFAGEVQALQQYLNGGGRLLLLLDPEGETGLEPLLDEWGVVLDERTIIDASGAGQLVGLGPATTLIARYGGHPITQDFTNSISVFPIAQPVGTLEVEGVEAVSLLITGEQNWAESDLSTEELTFDPEQDAQGPFDVGVALSRTQPESEVSANPTPDSTDETDADTNESATPSSEEDTDTTTDETDSVPESEANPSEESASESTADEGEQEAELDTESSTEAPESRLVVIGNSAFVTDGWFQQQINGDIFLNAMSWLVGEDEATLSIRPKDPENRRINLAAWQAATIGWLACFFVPLFGLVTAGVTWWRRR